MNSKIKTLILKIIFCISFVPYAVAIIIPLFTFCFGANFMGYIEPGLEALYIGLLYDFMFLVFIPAIPVCLIIHIVLFIRHQMIKKGKNISLKKTLIGISIFVFAVALIWLSVYFKEDIMDATQKQRALIMYYTAKEVVPYNTYETANVFDDSHFEHETMLIDWNLGKIAFVVDEVGRWRFQEFEIEEISDSELSEYIEYFDEYRALNFGIQSQCILEDGSVFTSYTDELGKTSTETVLVVIERSDGKRYGFIRSNGVYLNLNSDSFI